jgi:putative N6-adenine-specific DNA methylase
LPSKISATDIDENAVQAARQNAKTAGVDQLIEFHTCSYENTPVPEGRGVIFLNPPYGERMDAAFNKPQVSSRQEVKPGGKIIIRKAVDRKDNDDNKGSAMQRLEAIYQGVGDFFKNTGGGYRGYIFTGNLDMAKKVGLRTKRRLTFYNGEIECRLLEYELYAGSRKNIAPGQE